MRSAAREWRTFPEVLPLMEALNLAEVEHNPKNNRMRAL